MSENVSATARSEVPQEREETFDVLFKTIPLACALTETVSDEQGGPANFICFDANPAFEKIVALSRRNFIGKSIQEILPDLWPLWIEK